MTDDEQGPGDGANPFERYDIDPMQGPVGITERMRELAEAAETEDARRAIRAAWEELTRHPARRFEAALGAHPDSHGAAGAPPPPPSLARAPKLTLALSDLALRPSVLEALSLDGLGEEPLPDASYAADPVLGE